MLVPLVNTRVAGLLHDVLEIDGVTLDVRRVVLQMRKEVLEVALVAAAARLVVTGRFVDVAQGQQAWPLDRLMLINYFDGLLGFCVGLEK